MNQSQYNLDLDILSKEQIIAYNKFMAGKNIFITGPAGTGKSFLINFIYRKALNMGIKVQVCALTGCASILLKNCKSKTVHSWGGLGLATGSIETIINRIETNTFKKKEWKDIELLIVDEVSMMSVKLFNLLDYIGKHFKKCLLPFGGIQVIFLADFYQLPPVGNNEDLDTKKFCFESEKWFKTFNIENHIVLKYIFRQTDEIYKNILNQIRIQQLDEYGVNLLKELTAKDRNNNEDKIITKIFPKKIMVDNVNFTELEKLDTETKIFNMNYEVTTTKYTEKQIKFEQAYLKSCILCEEKIILKIGTHVMCVFNMSENIVNGSTGIVIGFDKKEFPIVKFSNGNIIQITYNAWESETLPGIIVKQIPLIYAWAITIHKCQGITLEAADIDVGENVFESGQTYVALSRVKSFDGLYLRSFDESKIKVNEKVVNFYKMIGE